jgi:hypothetical protein
MDTQAYKSRSWWVARALRYARDAINDASWSTLLEPAGPAQCYVWTVQARESMANACAATGSDCLTRTYVDRQGNWVGQ